MGTFSLPFDTTVVVSLTCLVGGTVDTTNLKHTDLANNPYTVDQSHLACPHPPLPPPTVFTPPLLSVAVVPPMPGAHWPTDVLFSQAKAHLQHTAGIRFLSVKPNFHIWSAVRHFRMEYNHVQCQECTCLRHNHTYPCLPCTTYQECISTSTA